MHMSRKKYAMSIRDNILYTGHFFISGPRDFAGRRDLRNLENLVWYFIISQNYVCCFYKYVVFAFINFLHEKLLSMENLARSDCISYTKETANFPLTTKYVIYIYNVFIENI